MPVKSLLSLVLILLVPYLEVNAEIGVKVKTDIPVTTKSTIIATVNGYQITKKTLIEFKKTLRKDQLESFKEEGVLDELISQVILSQEAKRLKLDQEKATIQRIQSKTRLILAKIAITKELTAHPIVKEDIEAEYEALKPSLSKIEYEGSHIQTTTEKTALEVLEKLKKGADFEHMVREYSIGPTKENKGYIGWFSEGQMITEMTNAIVNMKNGTFSQQAIKTKFGWHILFRHNQRNVPAPKLDQIFKQIAQMLSARQIQNYINALKKKANISLE